MEEGALGGKLIGAGGGGFVLIYTKKKKTTKKLKKLWNQMNIKKSTLMRTIGTDLFQI